MTKKKLTIYSTSFLAPLLIILVTWYFNKFFPFGSESFLAIDFNQQFVDMYIFMRNAIRQGDFGSLSYSFTKTLGGNMVGAWAYYLMSPFNLFYVFLPMSMISYAVFFSVWLRYGAMGLAMAYYLVRRHHGSDRTGLTIALSTVYGLNGFAVAYQTVPIFMDALWLMPLVLVAMEELLDGGRPYKYAILLGLTMIIQYYMGYMICLFIGIYSFYYVFTRFYADNKENFWSLMTRRIGTLILYSLIAIGLSAFLFIPNYYNLIFSKGALESSMLFDWEFQINPLEILSKLMIGSFDNNGWSAGPNLPNIYVGSVALVGLVAYYFSDVYKWGHKVATSLVFLIFFLSISHEWTSKIWHMGQNPAGYFYRFSWILIFFILVVAYQGLKDREFKSQEVFIGLGLIFLLQAIVLPQEHSFLTPEQRQASALLLGLAWLIFYLVRRQWLKWALLLVLTFSELGVNAFIDQSAINHNDAYKFENALDVIGEAIDQVRPDQEEFYRITKSFYRSKNDPMSLNYPGLTNFSSSLEGATRTLFERLGNSGIDAAIYYYGTPLTDALFGIKYMVGNKPYNNENKEVMDKTYVFPTDVNRLDWINDQHKVGQTERFDLFENPHYLPIAFGVPQSMAHIKLADDQALDNQVKISQSLSSSGQSLFEPVEAESSYNNLIHGATQSGQQIYSLEKKDQSGTYTLKFTPNTNDPYFIEIPKSLSTYQDETVFMINGKKLPYRAKFGSNQVFNIAYNGKGHEYEFAIELKADRQYNLTDLKIYQFKNQDFEKLFAQMKDQALDVKRWGSNYVEGTIHIKDYPVVFTSIPYDKGWQVYVDGKRVETRQVWESLLAFDITPGDHQVELVFHPKGAVLGSAVSGVSLLALVGLWIMRRRKEV